MDINQKSLECLTKLNHLYNISSKSKRKLLGDDYSFLDNLFISLGFPSPEYPKMYCNVICPYVSLLVNNIEELGTLSSEYIELLKQANYYCYMRMPNIKISRKEQDEIITEFFIHHLKEGLKIYNELKDSGHIFCIECPEEALDGMAIPLQSIDEYFIELFYNGYNSILRMESVIHEVIHIYCAKFLKDYPSSAYQKFINGLFPETPNMLFEIMFYHFLKDHHIYFDEALLHRNYIDGFNLKCLKVINYLNEISKSHEIFISASEYQVYGKNRRFTKDKGIPFFQYHTENFVSGETKDTQYGIGIISGTELYYQTLLQEDVKRVVDTFLINQQHANDYSLLDSMSCNKDFFLKENQERMSLLLKKYPLPGYNINQMKK